jgi:HAD superfamily hydrolase (TIGR01450 family)
VPLTALAGSYDQFILDLDGCVWVGDEPTPGAPEAIAELREQGKRVAFATNNSFNATEDFVTRLWGIGVRASLADVVTVGGAVQHLLAETRSGRSAFVIGTPAMTKHVADAGLKPMNGTDLASRADVVIVASSLDYDYDDIRNATLAISRGADFLATGRDPTYPQPDGDWPGIGATVAAVEYATGRSAQIVGKPEPQLLLTALDRLGEGRTLVVGDRLDSDIAAAASAELDSALVLSGGSTREELEGLDGSKPRPGHVAETLAELLTRGEPQRRAP